MIRILLLSFFISCLGFFACEKKTNIVETAEINTNPSAKNTVEAMTKPYVILISLDGYRWDYTQRFNPPNITKFANEGVKAEAMLSCFPSKTFPNHYSIATGMFPENHGIVNNSFYDYEKDTTYKIYDRSIIEDGTWYGGTPLWLNAANSGMLTASFFFVGSEADIQGVRPTYYYRYNGNISNANRVTQVLDWLDLPEEKRPHLITAYFSDMDDTGHSYGPNDDEKLSETLIALDKTLGELFEGVKKTRLPVNIILVSDHGMMEIPVNQLLPLESVLNDSLYRSVSVGAVVHLYLNENVDENLVYEDLKSKENHWKVYRTSDSIFYKMNPNNPRLGDLLIIPDNHCYFKTVRQIGIHKSNEQPVLGHHGFDPEHPDLHAIFYANGPAFKENKTIEPFRNIHIYPMVCEVLGLEVPKEVDGDLEVLKPILK